MAKRNTYFEDEVVHKKIDIKQFRRICKKSVERRLKSIPKRYTIREIRRVTLI